MIDMFSEHMEAFFSDFGKGRKMVLSTSDGDRVSSRMMSIVHMNGEFYFQTDSTMRKYRQISVNNSVALCIDNIQIEGKCTEIGHPLENALFCDAFQECFKGSFDAYSALKNERLFVITPLYIERWIYQNGVSYVEVFDINNQRYSFNQYIGV